MTLQFELGVSVAVVAARAPLVVTAVGIRAPAMGSCNA